MIVMVFERLSMSLRGELTRWLMEVKPGIFVGRVSARVRDKLWEKSCEDMSAKSGGYLIYPTSETEQGFIIKVYGNTDKTLIDMEGLFFLKKH